MSIRADLLHLLREQGINPSRGIRLALDDLLAVVTAEHPDHLPPEPDDDDDEADDDDDDAGLAVRTIACPHCGEAVVVELELDGGEQDAIHDCSVCCRPIRLTWQVANGRLDRFVSGPG